MGADGVGGWGRTTIVRLTGARSAVELHRQTGARVRPLHIASRLSQIGEARGPRAAAPAPSRLVEASRGRTGAAPTRPPLLAEREAGVSAEGPRRPSSSRRAGGASTPAPPPPGGRGAAKRPARVRR